LTPSPIVKALSTLKNCNVRFLVMGGQACIVYGGAEFSRDLDIAVLAAPGNLGALAAAMAKLQCEPVFVPTLRADVLKRGHACHFRCHARGVAGLRIDVMGRLRGCATFSVLWKRRTLVSLPGADAVGVLSLPDLVRAKKTQRDKDWPMIRRLVEADYLAHHADPTPSRIAFWLKECRTPELLIQMARQYPARSSAFSAARPLLLHAAKGQCAALAAALLKEQQAERQRDAVYWRPLRKELERWRHEAAKCLPEDTSPRSHGSTKQQDPRRERGKPGCSKIINH